MRIAVTGASGFMGGVVARQLAAQGHSVFSFGRRPAEELSRALPGYTRWDFASGPVSVPSVEAVVHCAARVGDWGPYEAYRQANVEGTRVVLETFSEADLFVHVSSASVYSHGQGMSNLNEDASVGRGLLTAYSKTKLEAEKVVLASGRNAVVLRPHIVYGPGDTTIMPRVLAARMFGRLPVPGDGLNRVSVTHIYNFAHAIERVLELKLLTGVFNIADSEEAQMDELLSTLLQRYGAPTRLSYLPRSVAWRVAGLSEWLWRVLGKAHAPRLTRYLVQQIADDFTLDLSRAKHMLNYTPQYTFRDGPLGEDDA